VYGIKLEDIYFRQLTKKVKALSKFTLFIKNRLVIVLKLRRFWVNSLIAIEFQRCLYKSLSLYIITKYDEF